MPRKLARPKTQNDDQLRPRDFRYRPSEFDAWIAAHGRWSKRSENPTVTESGVWGRYAAMALCGRFSFSNRNQARYHFGETLVAARLEREGYICWTKARIIRPPDKTLARERAFHTDLVEAWLRKTGKPVPQVNYRKLFRAGTRLKAIDVVGYHCGRNAWVFAEVKKGTDRLHPEQEGTLRFLKKLMPDADVFVASVQEQGSAAVRRRAGKRDER